MPKQKYLAFYLWMSEALIPISREVTRFEIVIAIFPGRFQNKIMQEAF